MGPKKREDTRRKVQTRGPALKLGVSSEAREMEVPGAERPRRRALRPAVPPRPTLPEMVHRPALAECRAQAPRQAAPGHKADVSMASL